MHLQGEIRMGKFFDKFKQGVSKVDQKVQKISQDKPKEEYNQDVYTDADGYDNIDGINHDNLIGDGANLDFDDGADIQPAQKPESFHHFILENQYKDLERSIRGFKDLFNKEEQKWVTKRKEEHCFTDEEAEEILRTAQSHLATDIKLGFISKEAFPLIMDAIYKELAFLFESIAEYRYGRYGHGQKQYQMKLQNHKIFLELFTRVQANYSRAIQGSENKMTHSSVKGQESLQGTDRNGDNYGGGYR